MEKYGKMFSKMAQWIDEQPLNNFIESNVYDGYEYFLDDSQLIEECIFYLGFEFDTQEEFEHFFDLALINQDVMASLDGLRDTLIEQVDELNEEYLERIEAEADFDKQYHEAYFRSTRL
jgi:hypothetical protein